MRLRTADTLPLAPVAIGLKLCIAIEFAKNGVCLLFLMCEPCYALEDKTDAHN